MLKCSLLLGLLAVLTLAASAPAAETCGLTPVDGTYLTSISRLHKVSCAGAKRVYDRAAKQNQLDFCATRSSSHGWMIRHRGSKAVLHVRFTKGTKAFDVVATQGSCT